MNFLSKIFKSRQCFFCKKKIKPFTIYENDKREKIDVCPMCIDYAERRLYKKLK
ncbi:hypothetical protein RZN25_17635 [Bacillaceae bacterium S4-13-56]